MPGTDSTPARSSPARRRWALALALLLHVVSGGWLLSSKGIGQYFYDERFTLENVRRVALQGHPIPDWYFWYAPLSYLPQATTLLAADRLGDALGVGALDTLRPTGEPTVAGIRLARSFGILFGCLTLIALHRIVRRMWDDETADFATVVLAASPWFTRGNAEFKPDALVVLACVAFFLPLVRYVLAGDGRARRWAAVAAGAAAAAKLNGVLVVVPLGLACLLEPTWRRRILLTLETALVTIVSFLLLNPFPGSALAYLRRVDRQWSERGEDLNFVEMLGTMLGKLFKSTYLGPLFAIAALAGLALTITRWRLPDEGLRPRAAKMLWTLYPTVYLVFLCATTRYPKENNLLPILPFAATFAGVGLAALARRATRLSPRLARAILPAVALLGLASLTRYVVLETRSQDVDQQVVDVRRLLGGGYGRVVAWWGGPMAIHELVNSGWNGPPPLALPLDEALAGDADRLQRLDCVGGYGEPPAAIEQALSRTFEIRRYGGGLLGTRLFQRTARPWHGCRPWLRVGEPIRLEFTRAEDGWFAATLPASLPPYEAYTLNGRVRIQEEPLDVRIGGEPFPAREAGSARQRWLLIGAERAQGPPLAGAEVRIHVTTKFAPTLEILLWTRSDESALAPTQSAPTDDASAPLDDPNR